MYGYRHRFCWSNVTHQWWNRKQRAACDGLNQSNTYKVFFLFYVGIHCAEKKSEFSGLVHKWPDEKRGQRVKIHQDEFQRGEKQTRGRIELQRASSCEEVQFVLVKLAAIWLASELVLEVSFIAAFIAWQAHTAPMRKCLPTCQCTAIELMERNKCE